MDLSEAGQPESCSAKMVESLHHLPACLHQPPHQCTAQGRTRSQHHLGRRVTWRTRGSVARPHEVEKAPPKFKEVPGPIDPVRRSSLAMSATSVSEFSHNKGGLTNSREKNSLRANKPLEPVPKKGGSKQTSGGHEPLSIQPSSQGCTRCLKTPQGISRDLITVDPKIPKTP